MVSAAAVGLMVLTVLVGVLLNSTQLNRLGDRLEKVEANLNGKIDRLDGKIDRAEKSLNDRIDKLDAKVDRNWDASHKDALEIMRQMTSLHERVAVVESKANG